MCVLLSSPFNMIAIMNDVSLLLPITFLALMNRQRKDGTIWQIFRHMVNSKLKEIATYCSLGIHKRHVTTAKRGSMQISKCVRRSV